MDELKTIIYNKVRELHVQKYPYNDFFIKPMMKNKYI